MSECWNCGTEFTLSQSEIKCDNCKKVVNFPCHKCCEWFSIEGLKQCAYCGFYPCPNCHICRINCDRDEHFNKITSIVYQEGKEEDVLINEIIDYFGDVKLKKDRQECDRNVSISYAKARIKACVVRTMGFRTKNKTDLEKFKKRYEEILDTDLGKQLTVNSSREAGSYGQEFRDAFNYAICMGKLKKIKIKKDDTEYDAFERIEMSQCPYLDLKDLIVKECPNLKCKIKSYPLKEEFCICPECIYKMGKNKGQLRKLNPKISNKDICQLKRGEFKKDGEGEYLGRDRKTD